VFIFTIENVDGPNCIGQSQNLDNKILIHKNNWAMWNGRISHPHLFYLSKKYFNIE
jgi:hypothetical protein